MFDSCLINLADQVCVEYVNTLDAIGRMLPVGQCAMVRRCMDGRFAVVYFPGLETINPHF